jgi:hypothetical protein
MANLRGGTGVLDSASAYTSSGTATSSTYFASPGHTVVCFSVKATTAGTWGVYVYSTGTSELIQVADCGSVTANTRAGYGYAGSWLGGYVLKFTDTSGGSGTVEFKVEGEGPSMGGWGGGQTAS